jgi:hypothetical protein
MALSVHEHVRRSRCARRSLAWAEEHVSHPPQAAPRP